MTKAARRPFVEAALARRANHLRDFRLLRFGRASLVYRMHLRGESEYASSSNVFRAFKPPTANDYIAENRKL
jgi:hypothetical protein